MDTFIALASLIGLAGILAAIYIIQRQRARARQVLGGPYENIGVLDWWEHDTPHGHVVGARIIARTGRQHTIVKNGSTLRGAAASLRSELGVYERTYARDVDMAP